MLNGGPPDPIFCLSNGATRFNTRHVFNLESRSDHFPSHLEWNGMSVKKKAHEHISVICKDRFRRTTTSTLAKDQGRIPATRISQDANAYVYQGAPYSCRIGTFDQRIRWLRGPPSCCFALRFVGVLSGGVQVSHSGCVLSFIFILFVIAKGFLP